MSSGAAQMSSDRFAIPQQRESWRRWPGWGFKGQVHQFSRKPTSSHSRSELRSTRVRVFYWCSTLVLALAKVWVSGRSREEREEPNVAPVNKTEEVWLMGGERTGGRALEPNRNDGSMAVLAEERPMSLPALFWAQKVGDRRAELSKKLWTGRAPTNRHSIINPVRGAG